MLLLAVNEIEQLIRRTRKETGITQAELARLARTKQSAIARIETGAANPTFRTVEYLLAIMGKSLVLNVRPIEAAESGVDSTLIYRNLRLTPAERLRRLKAHSDSVARLREVGHQARKRAA